MSASLPRFFVWGRDYAPGQKGCSSRGGERGMESMMRERGGGESFVSFIAQTTGVSLIPSLEVMGKWGGSASPHSFNPPTCLQDSSTLSKFASILDKASVISTLQHMVCATLTPQLQHACRRAHKGHFLNIFCSSYYKTHQKLKRQSRKASGKRETPGAGFTQPTQGGEDENLACFTIFIRSNFHIWWEKTRLPCL